MVVDLDALEAPTDSESGDAQHNPDVWELRHRLTEALAELRAARKVIEQVRLQSKPHAYLRRSLAAYDEAVAG